MFHAHDFKFELLHISSKFCVFNFIKMFFLLLVLVVISLILIQDFVKKRGYRWKKLSEFPGDTPLPLIGNGFDIGFDADGNNF